MLPFYLMRQRLLGIALPIMVPSILPSPLGREIRDVRTSENTQNLITLLNNKVTFITT